MDCQYHEKVIERVGTNEGNIRVMNNKIENNEKDIEEMKTGINKLSEKVLSIQVKVAIGSVIFYTVVNMALWFFQQAMK